MTEELRAKMEELRAIAPRLNRTTDQANAAIDATQAFLNGLSLGIEGESSSFAEVPVEDSDPEDGRMFVDLRLAYGRLQGDFCIHVLNVTLREDRSIVDGWDEVARQKTPWRGLSRQLKLQSFVKLTELLEDIFAKAKAMAEDAEAAGKTVEEMLSSLGVPAKPVQRIPDPSRTVFIEVVERETLSPDQQLAAKTALMREGVAVTSESLARMKEILKRGGELSEIHEEIGPRPVRRRR